MPERNHTAWYPPIGGDSRNALEAASRVGPSVSGPGWIIPTTRNRWQRTKQPKRKSAEQNILSFLLIFFCFCFLNFYSFVLFFYFLFFIFYFFLIFYFLFFFFFLFRKSKTQNAQQTKISIFSFNFQLKQYLQFFVMSPFTCGERNVNVSATACASSTKMSKSSIVWSENQIAHLVLWINRISWQQLIFWWAHKGPQIRSEMGDHK